MAFDAVGKFVESKSLGLDASSAGILHRKRSQRSTIVSIAVFFGHVAVPEHEAQS